MKSVLTKKVYKTYEKISRYSIFPIYFNKIDEKYFYGITAQLRKDTPYTAYKVKSGDTLDSLALDFYGNPVYYWIIADFNSIQDPYTELEIGEVLNIPTFSSIEFDLGEL